LILTLLSLFSFLIIMLLRHLILDKKNIFFFTNN